MLAFSFVLLFASVVFAEPFESHYELNKHIEFDYPEELKIHDAPTATPLEVIKSAGYNGEVHHVQTEDGYILELHRVTGARRDDEFPNKPVVLIMHGLLASSASWIIPDSAQGLPYILSDLGYDVWLGNARGSTYSRKHISKSIKRREFWTFSWHEIGKHDLPAMIDYILENTNREKLFYIGHSQGSTSFFVMASERPEYQEKVEAMFALAPVAYMSNMFSPVLKYLAKFAYLFTKMHEIIGPIEFMPSNDVIKKFAGLACDKEAITEPLCANIYFILSGYSIEQLNRTLLPIALQYLPAGASSQQIIHYAQLVKSGKFRQFDYGLFGNLVAYKKIRPPSYDLGKIKIPVYLHYSTNDWLASVLDVHKLHNELGNSMKIRVPHEWFNHIDFLFGKDVNELVYNKVISLLSRHQNKKQEF